MVQSKWEPWLVMYTESVSLMSVCVSSDSLYRSEISVHVEAGCTGHCAQVRVQAETLYHRDDALLYMSYVMLIWAAPIPADRWHCSLRS